MPAADTRENARSVARSCGRSNSRFRQETHTGKKNDSKYASPAHSLPNHWLRSGRRYQEPWMNRYAQLAHILRRTGTNNWTFQYFLRDRAVAQRSHRVAYNGCFRLQETNKQTSGKQLGKVCVLDVCRVDRYGDRGARSHPAWRRIWECGTFGGFDTERVARRVLVESGCGLAARLEDAVQASRPTDSDSDGVHLWRPNGYREHLEAHVLQRR